MANRKSKLSKYTVTLRRTVEFHAEVEIEARNTEEAVDLAIKDADTNASWREGDIHDQDGKAKLIR